MPAPAYSQPQQQQPIFQQPAPKGVNELARLAVLHAEAEETARLANMLGRSLYVSGALGVGALVTAALAAFTTPGLVWLGLSLAGAGVALIAYVRTMQMPFERAALLSFREDIKAMLLYAGFAWGAGAWLVLSYDASVAAVVAFAVIPVGAIAALIKDRDCAFLFGIPVAVLVSFASVLRPFSDAGLDAALVLIASGAIGAAVLVTERASRTAIALPFFKQIKA